MFKKINLYFQGFKYKLKNNYKVKMTENENNITFFIHDNDDNHENDYQSENNNVNYLFNLDAMVNDCENTEFDLNFSQIVDYNINYTVKDLLLICDYYGIAKQLKTLKSNKTQIIEAIVFFENDTTNQLIVFKRRKFWFYINELKNDKFMKKYIMMW